MSQSKKITKVEHSEREPKIRLFIQEGHICLEASKHLFKCDKTQPLFMYPAITLAHHGIELLLKACLV